MFRTQNNVPENYINESRDFQLLCRLYDINYNALKYNIDGILNLNDPFKINDRFLPLLATKVGFITDKTIEPELMRYILSSFNIALKYKGSIKGVKTAIATILRYENKDIQNIYIDISYEDGVLSINLNEEIDNREALDEYLKYILPTGCTYSLTVTLGKVEANITPVAIESEVNSEQIETSQYSVYYSDSIESENFPDKYKSNNQASEIINNSTSSTESTTNE